MKFIVESLFSEGELVIPKCSVLKDTLCEVLELHWSNALRAFEYRVQTSQGYDMWYCEHDLMTATQARINELERLYAEYGD